MRGPPEELVIRSATPDDVPLVLVLIKELVEYERMGEQVVATEAGDARHRRAASP